MTTERQGIQRAPSTEQQLILDQREANAHMVGATIRAQELTEQAEQAMNELRASEDRYRTLFDVSPVAVYSCSASGVIEKFNRRAAALWGREPALGDTDERFCGSHKLFRVDGSFMPHEECPMAEVLSGTLSEVRDAEVQIERPDGSRVAVIVNILPLLDQHGQVTSAINCFYDITGRKQAERQLAAALDRERELATFREMFLGIVGHDLRTPLNNVTLTCGILLRRGHLDEHDQRSVGRIVSSGQRMTRMISQLLDLTRARLGGGLLLEASPTDLCELCRGIAEEFETRITLDMEGDLTGTWDPDRLQEVVANLVGNAVEHAAPGTAVVIRARGDGGDMLVDVINQGPPIPPNVLPFIFEPFRRARQQQKSATGNLGLGLYIAQQIVLSHGGTLEARCAGGTTTFAMRLPRRPPQADGAR